MVNFLLQNGFDVNITDKLNRTPLMDAAEMGNDKIVQYLIEQKADVNLEDKENRTALSYCIDYIDIPKPIQSNIQSSIKTDNGNVNNNNNNQVVNIPNITTLNSTEKLNKFENCALALIENNANVNTAGKFNNSTLLHYAALRGNLDLCRKIS